MKVTISMLGLQQSKPEGNRFEPGTQDQHLKNTFFAPPGRIAQSLVRPRFFRDETRDVQGMQDHSSPDWRDLSIKGKKDQNLV